MTLEQEDANIPAYGDWVDNGRHRNGSLALDFAWFVGALYPFYTPHHFRLQKAYMHLQAQLTWQAVFNNIGLEIHDISGRLDNIGIW